MRILGKLTLLFLWIGILSYPVLGGTWTSNKFFYKPNLGARGSQEKALFDSALDQIDARLGKQIFIGDPDYGSTLATAITKIGLSRQVILVLPPGTWSGDNLTIPSNVMLHVLNGATITVSEGTTLTINGPFQAGIYHVFSCTSTGKVVFGEGAVKKVYPEWWGGAGDNTTDNTAAINAAIASLPSRGGIVQFQEGRYQVASKITGASNLTIQGKGPDSTFIYYSYEQQAGDNACDTGPGNKVGLFDWDDGTTDVIVKDLALIYTGTFDEGGNYAGKICGLNFGKTDNVLIDNVDISGFNHSGTILRPHGDNSAAPTNFKVINSRLHNNATAGLWISSVDEAWVEGNFLYNNGIQAYNNGFGMACSYPNTGGVEPTNVVIKNNMAYHNMLIGIDCHSGNNLTIDGNTAYGSGLDDGHTQREGICAYECDGPIKIINNYIHTFRDTGFSSAYPCWAITVGYGGYTGTTLNNHKTNVQIRGNIIDDFDVTGGSQTGTPIIIYDTYQYASFLISENNIDANHADVLIKSGAGSTTGAVTYDRFTVNNNILRSDNAAFIAYFSGTTSLIFNNNTCEIANSTDSDQSVIKVGSPGISGAGPTYHSLTGKIITSGNLSLVPSGWTTPKTIKSSYPPLLRGNTINGAPESAQMETGGWLQDIASANATIYAYQSGENIINSGSNTRIAALPAATVGLQYTFVQKGNGKLRVTPNGSETVGAGTPGQYLELDQNESVSIRCLSAGSWDIVAINGTPTYGS